MVAGVAVAFATFKPTYGLPLAVLLLAYGGWRALAIGGAVAGVLTILVLVRLVAVSGGVTGFVATLEDTYAGRSAVAEKRPERSPYRVDVVALAGRVLRRSPRNGETVALTLGVLAVAAVGLRRLAPARGRDARVHATTLAALATVACAYHQQYDLVVLALPLVALVWCSDAAPWNAHPALRRFALVVLPLVNYVASETAAGALGLSEPVLLAPSSLDNLALLALVAIFALLAWSATFSRAQPHSSLCEPARMRRPNSGGLQALRSVPAGMRGASRP